MQASIPSSDEKSALGCPLHHKMSAVPVVGLEAHDPPPKLYFLFRFLLYFKLGVLHSELVTGLECSVL